MSDTTTPQDLPPGQGGPVPGLPTGIPPGFSRIPIERLRELNVPAADRKSIVKRTGSNVSVDFPVQNESRPPAELGPLPDSGFEVGGGGGPTGGTTAPTNTGLPDTTTNTQTTALAAGATANPIVLENQKPGNPKSEWDLSGPASSNIEGFTTEISANAGQRVDFKINTDSRNYRVDIYRLGDYGGLGARRVATLQNTAGTSVQLGPLRDDSTGMVDAGNWRVTDSWTIPADAVSGVYIAKLVRQDGTFGESHVPFIVRNDGRQSDVVFQTSDQTWQAYNGWGGANLYGGTGPGGGTAAGRAYAVSYNRPIVTRDGIGLYAGPQDYIFGAEYSALRWMERNGYDVSYISGIDASRDASLLRNAKIFTSTGHDEYWTGQQRANVEAARDAGVNLAFWSGNEVYWKTRLAASPTDGGANRTLISYKETRQGNIDPTSAWTGTFRDLTYGGATDGGRPENALTGTLFQVDSYRADAITIPYGQSQLRIWRDTSVANLQPGQTATLTKNYLGYEWDASPDNGARPDGLIKLSTTNLPVTQYLMDFGNYVGDYNATHNLTLYRAPSGALVFGAGTVYWSWGLDANHDLTATPTDLRVQQAMVNLFADMGVQPQTLQTSLKLASKSTDTTAPVSSISSPTTGGSLAAGQKVTISGTASDVGGVVAGVEVSTDGGQSWHPASGTASNWTYTWKTPAPGTYTIRSRAVDDTLNRENPGPGRSVTVTPSPSINLFQDDTPGILSTGDTAAVQLGVKFTASQNGAVTGVRFYKGSQNTGTHVGSLWTATGTRLAQATFTNESASGWQQVNFASPVAISAGTTYVAAYHTSSGRYALTPNYFMTPVQSGQLTAPAAGPNSFNGVFAYGNADAFPNEGRAAASNYWVDVVYTPGGQGEPPPPAPPTTAVSLFSPTDTPATVTVNDGSSVELGVKFTSSQAGTVTGIRFYKGSQNTGTHVGSLWSATGQRLAQATFTNETASGWQQVSFASPVAITAGTTYVASYLAPNGNYSASGNYFSTARTSGPLTAPSSAASGGNGVYRYGASAFPNQSFNATNYWVDVTFEPTGTTPPAAGVTVAQSGGSTAVTEGGAGDDLTVVLASQPTANVTVTVNGNADLRVATGTAAPAQSTTLTFTAQNWNTAQTVLVSAVNDTLVEGTETSSLTFAAASSDARYNGLSIPATSVTITDNDSAPQPAAGVTVAQSGGATAVTEGGAGDDLTVVLASQPTANVTVTVNGNADLRVATGTAAPAQSTTLTFTAQNWNTAQTVLVSAVNDTLVEGTETSSLTFAAASSDARYNGLSIPATSVTITDNDSAPPPSGTVSLFSATAVPGTVSVNEPWAVELGVKFTASQSGTVDGVRFYKAANNTGTHTGSLWSATGQRLGQVTFSGETGSGWQQANFATPVAITAGTTYVASYFAPAGNYSLDSNYFSTARTNGPLTAPSSAASGGNGVFNYASTSSFPNQSFNASNYWVDVAFRPSSSPPPPPPAGTSSLFSASDTPATVTVNDQSAVQLGVKFRASQNGSITGIRFYKGPQNTGTHVGSLWTTAGARLAQATFTNETASGWQQVNFATPVAITAGTTYVASYSAPNGNYSASGNYFGTDRTSGPLTAPSSASSGGNGVYAYGGASAFPNQTFNANNYWVDVVFQPQVAA